jgi:hypothetical protein
VACAVVIRTHVLIIEIAPGRAEEVWEFAKELN